MLHCVHRCLLTFVHLYPSDAMLHRADLLCRIGSVCARPAPTSRAQTQASVLPRSCSGRSRRLLATSSASLTRGERRSDSKVLVCLQEVGSHCVGRLQHGRCRAYTDIQRARYTGIYTAKSVMYTPIQLTHLVPHDCSRIQRTQCYTVLYSYTPYTAIQAIHYTSLYNTPQPWLGRERRI